MIAEFIDSIIRILLNFSLEVGFIGTFIWMIIESSFIPWPSELLLIPQGVLISQGKLSLFSIILAATLGSLVGSLINYFLALYLGRRKIDKVILKYGKFLFINKNQINQSERFFNKHGKITTFVGRLIPGVRQIISLPAGFAKMNLTDFCIFTTLGAFIWSSVIIFAGYLIGKGFVFIKEYMNLIYLGIGIICLLLIIIYIRFKKN